MKSLTALTFAILFCAGAAQAQTPNLQTPNLQAAYLARPTAAAVPKLDLTSPHTSFDVAYSRAPAARIPGVARTSVDKRLGAEDLTGSLGFLCGLEPGAGSQGAAAARGYDPSGRFLGAKLKLAFR